MSDHIPILGFAAVSREHALKRIRDLEAETQSLRQQLEGLQKAAQEAVRALRYCMAWQAADDLEAALNNHPTGGTE